MPKRLAIVQSINGVEVVMTSPRARVAGVNRDGQPIGVMHKIPGRPGLWSCTAYTTECPWDTFVGALSLEDGARSISEHGSTPDHLRRAVSA